MHKMLLYVRKFAWTELVPAAQVVSAPMYTLFIYATCAPRAVAIKILNVTRSMNMSMNMSKNMKKV